jgi:phage terminase large subunit
VPPASIQLRARAELELRRRRLASPASAFNPEVPPAFTPLLAPARYKGAYGGRGGAKSHFFAEQLLRRCLDRPGTRAVCVREVQRSLEHSCKRLIEDKIERYGLSHRFRVLNTHIETPGGGVIIFQGMQNHTAESIKSLEGFSVAWVEEAQALSERSLRLLRPTIRTEDSELWFSWNPRDASDPVDALLRSETRPPNAAAVAVSYADNPWLPDVLRAEMEWDRQRDPEKYAHVWLGEYERNSESRVFKNWSAKEYFETPANASFMFGGDWGFSIDPTVLLRCFLDGRKLYIDREVYRIGCEIDHTAALFDTLACGCEPPRPCPDKDAHGMARKWAITADSARPETISYLKRHGYPRIEPAVKGPNSVKEGVIFLQGYDIIVHPRCVHTIDELTMYSYKVDPLTGLVTPVLQDKKNHVIDSLRYAVEKLRAARAATIDCPY